MIHRTVPACITALVLAMLAGCAAPEAAPSVIRHPLPNSSFPIASAVEVGGDVSTVYLSGHVPPNLDATPSKDRAPNYGSDTKTQTIGTLRSIERTLTGLGLTIGDVIKLQVFLVGDSARGGRMDFAGFMEGYTQFFGTPDQPNLPARSVFQVAALANPAYLIEIEVVAIRRK